MTTEELAEQTSKVALTYLVPMAGKVIGAILLWVVGRMVVRAAQRVVRSTLERRKLDPTLVTYIDSLAGGLGTLLLLLAILSSFGVETTSFAGLLAAGGVAIGMAWSGLLSNFAAGVFLVILRPFKVGDMITGAGVTGVVREIGMFATTLDSADNIRIFVGNGKLFGDNIQNYTTNPYRRVELKAQLAHDVDPRDAIRRLQARVAALPGVLATPPPSIEILDFTLAGPVLGVRPFCHNDQYWDVYFATNAAIQDEFSSAGYPVPEQHVRVGEPDASRSAKAAAKVSIDARA